MDSSSSSSFSTTASERYSYHPTLRWNPQVEEYFVKAYGADHFARISRALTCPSCYSCIRVNTLRSTSDAVIEKLISILHERTLPSGIKSSCINENDATAEVANDARQVNSHKEFDLHPSSDLYSRQSTRLFGNEDISNGKSETPSILRCQLPGLDYVVFVKGSGPHMLQYGGAFGQSSKEVIVSRRCAEAVLRGAQIFVPGVLACSAHVETGDTVAVSVAVEQPGPDSDWNVGITRGIVLQGLQSDPHYHERSGLYIGQGTTMASRAGIFRASKGIAVEMTNRVYKLPSFHDVLEGEIFLQNLPSILAAHVLDPQQGERILDMCAAPGGKTTAIATLMRDKGEVVAVDRSHNKVMDILKLAKEMGLTCISAYKLDALKAVCQIDKIVDIGSINSNKEISSAIIVDSRLVGAPDIVMCPSNAEELNLDLTTKKCEGNGITNQTYLSKADVRKSTRRMRNGPGRNNCIGGRVENSKGYLPNSFDRVLLDAPCSALGLRPRLFAGEETIESLRKHARYQRRMFDQAVQLVRPGGIIVYSTCTINPGENEALVRYALDTYKFLSLASQHPRIGGPGLVGNCELFDGKYKEDWLTESEAELVQRFDPSSSLDTIGFFIAKFNVSQKAA